MIAQSVLIIHNFYRNKGGEDNVVMQEIAALKLAGVKVYEMYFQNPDAGNSYTRLFRFLSGIYFNLGAYWRVFRLVKAQKIQVVHVHNIAYQASPSVFWAARHAGAKVIATLHNYRLFCLNAIFYREGATCTACIDQQSFRPGIQHGCFRNSKRDSFFLATSLRLHYMLGSWHKAVHRFVVVNPLMKQYLMRIGIEPERIFLKPNFTADLAYAGYAKRNSFYLVAGRLEPQKGLPEVLQAFKSLKLPLHIAGEGPLQPEVEALSYPNISFLGQLNSGEMKLELANCKALVFASKMLEGMPLSIIEAMASGAVCIAPATEITRMMIRDGVTGLLFDYKDGVHALKAAIRRMEAMSLSELERMSVAARRQYEQKFTMREHLRTISDIYQMNLVVPENHPTASVKKSETAAVIT